MRETQTGQERSKVVFEIKSIEEIIQFLLTQADLRSPENDEAGVLDHAAYNIIKDLQDMEPGHYDNLNVFLS